MKRAAPLLVGMVLALSACADNNQRQRIIVLDPGHGGVDPGAIGSTSRTLEKEVALRMGRALRDRLEATGRYRVIMTRDDDRFVGLPERLEIARRIQGELFVSLHADSLVGAPEVGGASVYTLSQQASSDDLARVASNESGAHIQIGMDLSGQENTAPEPLIDPAEPDTNGESVRLAGLLVREMNGATKMIKRRPVQADFVVLTSTEIPSVLIELGYLSNPIDERALADDAHIARLASAITRALDLYFVEGPF